MCRFFPCPFFVSVRAQSAKTNCIQLRYGADFILLNPHFFACAYARRAREENFGVALRYGADFRPPVTPQVHIFGPRYENLFCPESVTQ